MALPNLQVPIILFLFLILHPSLASTSSSHRAIHLPLTRTLFEPNATTLRNHPRSRLVSARMPLYDDLAVDGYYTAHVMIGTPPKEFALVVDTGSTLTFVPCSTCEHCGNHHQDPKFHTELSMTYEPIICHSDCTCDNNGVLCIYDRQYADMSNSSGVLGTDVISFRNQSELAPQRAIFGCENEETGSLFSLRADGIMGLGRGDLSIVDQLVDKGVISDSFSLCYGGMDVGGGTMVLGGVSPPKDMIFTHSNVVESSFYNVELKEFHVSGKPLSLDPSVFDGKNGTAVLDSGTTFAFLPEAAFIEFKQAMMKELHSLKQIPGPDPHRNDICFSGAGSDISELSKYFPTLDMVFGRGQKLSLFPENYLFRHPGVHGGYCLGIFQNGKDSSTLLGAIVVRNTLVTYDRENEQIGFWKTNCSDIWERLNATGAPTPGPSTLEIPNPSALLPHEMNPTGASPYVTIGPKVGLISFYMFFNVTHSIIQPHIEELVQNMAEELELHASQVQIRNFTSVGNDSLIGWAISPAGCNDYISGKTARSIISRLAEHHIHLPEIFGSYKFLRWKVEPPLKWTWWQQHSTAVVLTINVALLFGISVLVTFFFWGRTQQLVVPYKPARSAVPQQELQLL